MKKYKTKDVSGFTFEERERAYDEGKLYTFTVSGGYFGDITIRPEDNPHLFKEIPAEQTAEKVIQNAMYNTKTVLSINPAKKFKEEIGKAGFKIVKEEPDGLIDPASIGKQWAKKDLSDSDVEGLASLGVEISKLFPMSINEGIVVARFILSNFQKNEDVRTLGKELIRSSRSTQDEKLLYIVSPDMIEGMFDKYLPTLYKEED